MAIFHASAKIISRSGGSSSVSSAAYRSGEKLEDKRSGITYNYGRKQRVDSTIILATPSAPDWVKNRERLWNEVERSEKRKDSQLAREFNIALPTELSKDQMKNCALEYVQKEFVDLGMIADIAFHDLESHNPHFHVMLTLRDITPLGFGLKNRGWNSKELLLSQREAWSLHANTALEKIGNEEKIDHRSLEAQGITDRLPQIHLGKLFNVRAKEPLEFVKYNIGSEYQEIIQTNERLKVLTVERQQLNREIEKYQTNSKKNAAAVSIVIRVMKKLNQRSFQGKKHKFEVSKDSQHVKIYSLDNRGLILESMNGKIESQLTDEDMKHLGLISRKLDELEEQALKKSSDLER